MAAIDFTEDHHVMLMKHDQDLYRGDRNNPGLTVRVFDLEQVLGSIRDNLKRLFWAVCTAILAIAGSIIVHIFVK